MASTNFKLFDENKANMMSDTEYNINTQRLNGVQAGIASSKLQNKTLHQTSLVAYSLAQIMIQNGYDADLVIFHESTLKANADFKDGTKLASGIKMVFVNGTLSYQDMKMTGAFGGRCIL